MSRKKQAAARPQRSPARATPAAKGTRARTTTLDVVYVRSDLRTGLRPTLQVFAGDPGRRSEHFSDDTDTEHVGTIEVPADALRWEVEAAAMRAYGTHAGAAGRPVAAEYAENVEWGLLVGEVAIVLL